METKDNRLFDLHFSSVDRRNQRWRLSDERQIEYKLARNRKYVAITISINLRWKSNQSKNIVTIKSNRSDDLVILDPFSLIRQTN